ncbi:MAG: hypothetical protein ABIT38_10225, partial [Gemmatimonadaceae bacterium]
IAKPSDAESSLLAGAAVDRAPPTLDASALLEVARNETANSGSGSSDATRNLLPLTAETQHSATINPLLTASTSAPPSGHAPIAARNDSALSVVSGSLTKGRQLMVGGLVVAAALAAWFAFRPHAVAVVSTSSTGPTLPTKSDSLSLREDSTHVVTPPDSLQDTTRVAAADTSAVKASDTASVAPPAPPAPTTAPPPPPTPPPAVASRIALGDITSNPLVVGEHIRLRAQARSAAGARLPNAKLSWRAEPPGILRVSDRGELAAIAPGSATVVVASGKATLRKDFRVVPATLTSLKLFVYSPLKRGDSTTYRVTASDQRGHPFSTDGVRWSSNNDRVLSIDNRGVAHAKKKGVASIRATLGPLTTALDVRVDDPADALQSTSPASSPSSPTSSAIPAFPELEMRGKVQECLKALRTRDSERMRVLAGSPATDPSSPLEHLLSLMRPKDAKFQLLNTYFSDASRVSGTRATLDYGVRVGWLKLTGEEADSRLNFRALYEVKDNAWRFGWCAPQNGANLTR